MLRLTIQTRSQFISLIQAYHAVKGFGPSYIQVLFKVTGKGTPQKTEYGPFKQLMSLYLAYHYLYYYSLQHLH